MGVKIVVLCRYCAAVAVGVLGLLLLTPNPGVAAGPDASRPLCKECRRFWDSSPGRIDLALRFSKTVKHYQLCSMFCLAEFMEDYPDKEPEAVLMVNCSTLEQELAGMVRIEKAHFVLCAEGDEEKTSAPFIFAFGSAKLAGEAAEEMGGEVIGYDEAWELAVDAAKEYERSLGMDYSPLKKRKR